MIDRFASGAAGGGYRPTDPLALTPHYLDAVDDYLRRVQAGEPTGRAFMQQTHPDAPCHTGGAHPSACPHCGNRIRLQNIGAS